MRWAGAVLAILVVAIAIFLLLFRWNWLRGPIDDYASARLHRSVAIHGDLSGHVLTWTPSLTARDVTVAQPAWAGRGPMATLPRLTVALDLHALLRGKLVLAAVDANRPTVAMQRDAAGRNNWTFGAPTRAPAPLKLPPIRHFTINDGRLTLNDARRRLHFDGRISSNERITGYGRGRFTMDGNGDLNGAPFRAQIFGGPLINIDPDRPYPFQTDIHAGATHVLAKGAITRPFDLGVMQASGSVTGDDLAALYQLTGLALPNSPPYSLSGRLDRRGHTFDVTGLHGRLGSSDLAGHVVVREEDDGRKRLTGTLASRRLKLADLTPVIGGAPRGVLKGTVASPKQKAVAAKLTAEHRVLPDSPFDVSRIRQTDVDVRYKAGSVDAGPLPVRQLTLHAKLDHGLLLVEPLSLTLPQGALSGHIRLDARGATPLSSVDLMLARAQVQELLPAAKLTAAGPPPVQGLLEARARLTGAGDSVRAAAANANGLVAVVVPQGQMRQLFAELLGIDVGRSLFLYLSKDQKPTPVRCAVAEFRARGGVLTAERLLVDTGAVRAEGGGVIDLRNETLNLSISGKPKHFRLLRIAAPITLKGRLDDPKLGVDLSKAAPQAGIAVALGALVSPFAAILPFISAGGAKDADCGALLAEAATHGAPVSHGAIAAKH
ncbi:MAG TPA: AsmA family protein [Caulobacteraceae bacterium]|nr:AsmA family protein [Caulobacteraceae bacterium]